MNALLIGSGGRESALAWALNRSSEVAQLYAMPGNPGIAEICEVFPGDPEDGAGVLELARRTGVDLVVVGPEGPLVAGVGNRLRAAGLAVFGPDADAARLEGSKSFAKEVMDEAGVPTARWHRCETTDAAIAALDDLGPPYVVKADGLAAGKGVAVTESRDDAIDAVRDRLERGTFGEAGSTVVVEEHLDGPEASLICFTDGRTVLPCEPAQDFKRAFDGDAGPNTGGMGAYSPVPDCSPTLTAQIHSEVLEPMVRALHARSAPFVGALYAGLALTSRGPKVVEFNARFGDPETQALIPRLNTDLGMVCMAAATHELAGVALEWASDACVAVVLASGGYPGSHRTGLVIEGLPEAETDGVFLFHAGTAREGNRLVTSAGRVLTVSALGDSIGLARSKAYAAASRIQFDGKHLRTDIGARAELAESPAR